MLRVRFTCPVDRCHFPILWCVVVATFVFTTSLTNCRAEPLMAGVAKIDITNREAGPVSDPLFAKALVLKNSTATAVVVTLDAVAVGEIGHIKNEYLGNVRNRLQKDIKLDPRTMIVNASHCHGIVCSDVEDRTVKVVKEAMANMVPVRVGAGTGFEDRVMENRRLKLKSGKEADVRHAYSLPADEEVESVGPIDPTIGILRLDRMNGETLAVLFHFACHPIQGVPSGANTADMSGFAARVVEENLSEGTIAFFLQGCGGDINPIEYKDVNHPRDAETLGNKLGLSTLKATRKIKTKDPSKFRVINESLELPRADLAVRIESMLVEQQRLLTSLRGTSLNLKTFLPLAAKYSAAPDFPSYYSHRYLHDRKLGREDLDRLDAENRRNMNLYINNILTMEKLTRLQTNLDLLKKHQEQNLAAGKRTIDVEVTGLRVDDFVWTTFPGELTVQIGLNLKKVSPHPLTFVSGYTNGYIYYSPTAEQLANLGGAQEDSDCILAPEWQAIYETKALDVLKRL